MNNDGKIYIIVTDKLPNGGGEPIRGSDNKQDKDKKENSLLKYSQHRFFNFIESQTKQFINFESNNIGNLTGNYVAQREVQANIKAAGTLMNMANATAQAVITTGSLAAGFITAGIMIAGAVISYEQQEKVNQMAFKQQNYELSMLKNRSGLYALDNESRTGGY